MSEHILVDAQTMDRMLMRLSHEIIEKNGGVHELYLVGIRRRGVPLAKRIKANIERFSDIRVELGALDITLYRDDLKELFQTPQVHGTDIPFDVNGKVIVLVDDVIYTGRTARAAMDALIERGRPAAIRLCVMVDRGHRELPIAANFVGKNVPTARDEFISVRLEEIDGVNEIALKRREDRGE
ncbi:MAG: bifunctional pyr operon transcriptional regulator/uracil phosphoribosyltransferase PyrR [Clostridia bacterium]|nr:bifunctional pyr operon transcriptional regulator/uracil phosphoribosyltransferase PyrR [Clostridia bacterium]